MNTMLDSVRIKTKLVVIYLITVLLSIGFLAVFYIRSITEDTKKIAYESMERNAQYVANSVSDLIANAFLISENLELDNTIEDFFSQRKQDYESYREVINTLQDFLAIHSNCISGIFYYSTARTYSSAGTLNYIEDVSALSAYDWGEEFLNSGKNILLVYSENVLQKKHLSIIRYSFSSNRSFDCVLKLDLNFSMIQSMLRDGGLNDYEYLAEFVQDGQVLFSEGGLEKGEKSISCSVPLNDTLRSGAYVQVSVESGDLYAEAFYRLIVLIPVALAVALLASGVILLISNSIIQRIRLLRNHLTDTTEGKYTLIERDCGKDEIGESIQAYNIMVRTIQALLKDVYEAGVNEARLQSEISDARYIALKAQVDPHYFYNVLNTIQARSLEKGETETAKIILTVARIFRDIISWKDDLIPIENEIDRIERFLLIQQYRFGDKFLYKIECPENLLQVRIPKMTLLTLVENACKHGLENSAEAGYLEVCVCETEDELLLSVYNNGEPLTEEDVTRIHGIMLSYNPAEDSKGLNNIYSRLSVYYRNRVHIDILPGQESGNTFVISIAKEAMKGRQES